jgi:6-phosphofructokinase 1
MGFQAVLALKDGVRGVMVGSVNRKVSYTPFEKAIKLHQTMNLELLEIAEVLSI